MTTFEGRLRRETDEIEGYFRFEVPGEPMPKSRARYNGQGPKVRAYTPTAAAEAEQVIAWRYRAARGKAIVADDRSGFGLACTFYVEKRQRRDTDNLIKLVADALNGVVWADDSQVTEVSGRTVHGSDQPRTVVELYLTGDLPDYIRMVCEGCGSEYRSYASWERKRRYCSPTCRTEARRLAATRTCEGCGEPFRGRQQRGEPKRFCTRACYRRHTTVALVCVRCGGSYRKPQSLHRANQRTYCSAPCRIAAQRDQRKVGAQGQCDACGGPTTKKHYIRCQACKSARRPALVVETP
ncbi:RusA family crossover junction endodeoxyribonuclease [Actinomycetospora aeridis]|uniref:RusA family crossover junction endodeoxyribonuclease n=1 Tax=Actinomycetospora aeridis TaxID=3129231 RepID=A0ABU8N164_9PSEU